MMAWELIGVVIVVVGFALRLNPLLIVLSAGLATGLVAKISLWDLLGMVGKLFGDNLFMTLPVVLLMPLIGLLEKHGLQERAAILIKKFAGATAGRIFFLYQVMREATSMFGLHIGGHAQMIRPLIAPMAEAASAKTLGTVSKKWRTRIRAQAAAAENWGNFFADDIFVAVGPVLFMAGVFDTAGVELSILELGLWGLPTAGFALVLGWWRSRALDKAIKADAGKDPPTVSS